MRKILFIVVCLVVLAGCEQGKVAQKTVREPAVAGSWYPGTQEELNSAVEQFLSNVKKIDTNGTIKAIIVPHAGYAYSGQVAATAFRQLGNAYENVFLLGPSHQYPLRGLSISNVTHYKTPLGEIELSQKASDMLNEELVDSIPEADKNEHSLEIELPFLQKQLANLKIIPILVGPVDTSKLKGLLLNYLSEDDLIVVSVDMSHYHPYDDAKKLDGYSIEMILSLDSAGIMDAEIDAPWAVATLLEIAKEKNWKPRLIYYANSGDVTGDKSKVVGYSTFMFVDEFSKQPEGELNKEEQEFLLKLARASFESYVKDKKTVTIKGNASEKLKKVQGCFVTLNKNGNLRGCIGHILPQEELYKCVIDNAVNAAVNDGRFNPVTEDEIKDIEVEVSVLTSPYKLEYNDSQELLEKLRPMVDGVVIKSGWHQSTYLPQVWEMFDSKEEFLSSLCVKGGASQGCWKDPNTEVLVYQAQVFSE